MPESSVPELSPRSSPADVELLQRVAQRDEAAFAQLYEQFKARVLNLAYRYLSSRDDAEVAAQDAFLRIWNNADKFRGSAQVWTWIYRITVNVCLNMKVHKYEPVDQLNDAVPASADLQPEDIHNRQRQEEIVRRAMDLLPADQRMATVLSRFEGMSYEEVAQTMNKSVRAVATLLFRARENLKTRLLPLQKRGLL
jgi:RNA polymerase sigma-70 factor (ECF subfamily)